MRRKFPVLILVVVGLLVHGVRGSSDEAAASPSHSTPTEAPSPSSPSSLFVHRVQQSLNIMYKIFENSVSVSEKQKQIQKQPKQIKLALVGFGRTGTTSLIKALEMLGYSMLHDETLGVVSDLHSKLYAGEITMDEMMLGCGERGYDGIFLFTDQFLEWLLSQEDVKVVLSVRDNGRRWAESWKEIATNIDYMYMRPFTWMPIVLDIRPWWTEIYLYISTQNKPAKYRDLKTLEKAYDAHIEKVKQMIPPERLLIFNVKQGWEPLCRFLNVPIPTTTTTTTTPTDGEEEELPLDFPHVNDRIVAKIIVTTLWLITWIWSLFPLIVGYMFWWIYNKVLLLLNKNNNKNSKEESVHGDDGPKKTKKKTKKEN